MILKQKKEMLFHFLANIIYVVYNYYCKLAISTVICNKKKEQQRGKIRIINHLRNRNSITKKENITGFRINHKYLFIYLLVLTQHFISW